MRKNQFTPHELVQIRPYADTILQPLREEFDGSNTPRSQAHAADFVARYILSWLDAAENILPGRSRRIGDYKALPHHTAPKGYEGLVTLSKHRLLKISHRINSVLLDWGADNIHLHLTDHELDPLHVLHLQTRGQRCVTCLLPPADLSQYTHDRDPLSFCLHDLMHAYHFYADPTLLSAQVGVARTIEKALKENILSDLYQQPDFQHKFEYAYADMNAHPIHLLKYLRAIMDLSDPKTADALWRQFTQDLPHADLLNRDGENPAASLKLTQALAARGEAREKPSHIFWTTPESSTQKNIEQPPNQI